ncbi:MAG: hypothetical protein FWE03_00210 [Firmicutes bacterium]|nr:hypothetical protein [Bacillota bacterium]
MKNLVLHKVNITAEAVFDYEQCLFMREPTTCKNCPSKCGGDWNKPCPQDEPTLKFPKAEYRRELEEYIFRHRHIKNNHYFRCKYLDEQTGETLLLFILKRKLVAYVQNWDVVGIIRADEWCEEKEEDGVYRNWYTTRINDPSEYDWVVEYRIKKELEAVEEKLEEVYKFEFKQERQCEHNRRFDKKNAKKSQARLAETKCVRAELESRKAILKERIKRLTGKT